MLDTMPPKAAPTPEVIPFGKYKGQPVEALAGDKQYCDWLASQPWFRERFQHLHTVIVNNFQQPSDTPEHNALQVLFLDDDYCRAFVAAVLPTLEAEVREEYHRYREEQRRGILDRIEAAEGGRREAIANQAKYAGWDYAAHYAGVLEDLRARLSAHDAFPERVALDIQPVFERRGIDVSLHVEIRTEQGETLKRREVAIEIKPTVGDDYPAVLRQMNQSESHCLFLETYTGVGATETQFRRIFAASGKLVVFRHQVESLLRRGGE